MYHGHGGNCGPCNKNVSSHREMNPVCGDVGSRFTSEDTFDSEMSDSVGDFDRFPLGMCYVPWQHFRNLYENEFVALAHGTLFKELDLDFYGRSCK
jgi:hypothetical protein